MPSLTPEERRQFVIPLGECPRCGAPKSRNYCRSCDEFFTVCACHAPRSDRHTGHRLYLYSDDGVVAVPDFDL